AATLLYFPEITEHYEILACYGTNGLTHQHLKAITEWTQQANKDKEIILFFDGDSAGYKATHKYAQDLKELHPEVTISYIDTPETEDINSLLQAYDSNIFLHLLNQRKASPHLLGGVHEPQSAGAQAGRLTTPNPDYKINFNNHQFITFASNNLQIIILGGINLQQLDRLRVTLKIHRTDTTNPLHSIRHSIDLYHSDYLEKLINKTSEQLEISTTILRKAIATLIEKVEEYRLSKIESQKEQTPKKRKLTEGRKTRAISYLRKSQLMYRTNQDIGKTGVVGENNNRLLMYLVFTSRLREQPLHIVSLGASGTGKTYLQEKIAELIPKNDKLEITILSENAFYYFEQTELKHKLVLIEDLDGAKEVLYPIRELQSKRWITKTIPIKDSKGNLKTISLRVEGPICLAGTTTREKLYEDNANRSLLIYLNTSPEHKELIMEYQRMLSAGKINRSKEQELKEFFKDMQTVLKPIKVRNPYAESLKLPEYIFKPLRTNTHYLSFIETVTFYHQYQREIKTDPKTKEQYIETTIEDIEWTNKLLKDILLAKSDELPKAVRNFFEHLKRWVKRENKDSFYAKEVQEYLRMYPMKVNRYIRELELRSFIRKSGGNNKSGFEYEVYRWDDYTKLQAGTDILDEILKQLRNKNNTRIT
ncbi:MAG: toprim domain-containing protein, partial [Bacteroidales bacterium]|nr:toprim domain-containing protein [Bacteroidales bacterium]